MPKRPTAASGALQVDVREQGRIVVHGGLTFSTATRARAALLAALENAAGEVTIDCADLHASDSAGLAVLLDCVAAARRSGKTLRFEKLPPQIRAVAAISEVEPLLG